METGDGSDLRFARRLSSMPPPAPPASKRIKMGVQRLLKDNETRSEIRKHAEEATWFDADAPSTRKRRQVVRANFEEVIGDLYGYTESADIWNISTFTEYSAEFLEVVAKFSRGVIGEKIRTDVLWQHKEGLYWWAIRFIPDFRKVSLRWHSVLANHIHQIGILEGLQTTHRHKAHLTDAELRLFYRQIFSIQQGRENWKQHYVAWLLVYITGVRPGSFTVCPGYEKGASLGINGFVRESDETLRWRDVTFFRFPDVSGIAVQIVFHHLKNQRDLYSNRPVEGKKKFTFLPTRGQRYELDISAMILGLGFCRGLFEFSTLAELHNSDLKFLPKVANVDSQAVFVASNQSGTIDVNTPMRELALNPKLQQMCNLVGLMEHNTIYAFRRTAITEVRRDEGTEFARDFAGHMPDSRAIMSYDVLGLSDVDITALRLHEEGAVSRDKIRESFQQAAISRLNADKPDFNSSLQAQLDERVAQAMIADESYISQEKKLEECLASIASLLSMEPLPVVQGMFESYRCLLREKRMFAPIQKLESILSERKALRKELKTKYMKTQKEVLLENHRKGLKAAAQKTRTPHGREHQFEEPSISLGSNIEAALIVLDPTPGEIGENEELDVEALQESLENGREQPLRWNVLEDEVVVHADRDGDGRTNEKRRFEAILKFIALESIPDTDLTCPLCALDQSVSPDKKNIRYTQTKLDRHINSDFHSREHQIQRAATISAVDGRVTCNLCSASILKRKLVRHVEQKHPEQMW